MITLLMLSIVLFLIYEFNYSYFQNQEILLFGTISKNNESYWQIKAELKGFLITFFELLVVGLLINVGLLRIIFREKLMNRLLTALIFIFSILLLFNLWHVLVYFFGYSSLPEGMDDVIDFFREIGQNISMAFIAWIAMQFIFTFILLFGKFNGSLRG